MTYFLKSGTRFKVTTKAAMDLHDLLPPATYSVKFDPMQGYYLELVEDFEITGKVYGDTEKKALRILSTFADRSASTGVMLTGEKGSGKTLLAKMLSIKARAADVPTFVINQPFAGEGFNTFMQMIEQPIVVIFDEFEKVYPREEQDQMLTLFDGVYASKKLFVITSNDRYRINEHMRNRPGRIYYRLDYGGLENDFIVEYCQDNLSNKSHIESLCRLAMTFTTFNFDMLKAMVEEMNRYGETPQQVMSILNAKPELSDSAKYTVDTLSVGGEDALSKLDRSEWGGNPLVGTPVLYMRTEAKDEDGDFEWKEVIFTPADLKHIDPAAGKFHYTNGDGDKLALSRVRETPYNWDAI